MLAPAWKMGTVWITHWAIPEMQFPW